jgi:hypothetical protein
MVIEYQIKRMDLARIIFYNLQHSRRTKWTVIGGGTLFFAYSLFLRNSINGQLVFYDFILSFLVTIGLILAVPVFFILTARTQKRILSINPEGIELKIGSREDKAPWNAVDRIEATQERILITGKNVNSFSIPASAFKGSEQRQSFMDLATQYQSDANREEFEHL